MARKKRRIGRAATRARVSDEELIERLKEKTPEVLSAQVPEAVFNAVITGLLQESTDEVPHFYCRRCGKYHLRTHVHHVEQTTKRRE
jgi:hypothetical protein